MKHTKLTSLLLVLAMTITSVVLFVTPASAEAWGGTSSDIAWYGDGTATEYTISTPAELAGLSTLAAEGKTFAGQTVKLSADIDLGGKPWTPIKKFLGTFDGDGHSILGLHLASEDGNQGFFSYVAGTVTDLRILGATAQIKGTSSGVLAGNVASGATLLVENVTVEAVAKGGTNFALMVGHSQGTITFRDVRTYGSVESSGPAAGYIGYARALMTFENCYNFASVKGGAYAGGFLGRSGNGAHMFTSCYNFGSISGTDLVGGIIAQYYGSIGTSATLANCANYGTVTCTNEADGNHGTGGLIGKVGSAACVINVLNCANYGAICGGGGYAGQIAGFACDKGALATQNVLLAGSASASIAGRSGVIIGMLTLEHKNYRNVLEGVYTTASEPAIAVGDTVPLNGYSVTLLTSDNLATSLEAMNAQVATWNDAKYSTWTVGNAPKISAASVTLGDCFAVNFYGTEAPVLAPHAATVSINGQTVAPKDGAVTVSGISAKELSSDIAVVVKLADGTVVQEFSYSITKYIERMMGEDAKLDALLGALSDYAKAAAGEDVDVDEAYANVQLTPVANVDNTYATELSVLLTDSIRPIVKVAEGVAQVNVEIYGQTYTYDVVDGEVIIDCLTATSLNNVMVLSFADAEGKVLGTTEYSVANCIKTYETYDVAKALAVYMQAVRAYNGLN